MKISEILEIQPNPFDKSQVEHVASASTTIDTLNGARLKFLEFNQDRILTVVDSNDDVLAFAGFMSTRNDTVWVSRNVESWEGGKHWATLLYKYVLHILKKKIQSDHMQTPAGKTLWTKSLPAAGETPKVLDLDTGKIYSASDKDPYDGSLRYVWCLSEAAPDYTESPDSLLQVLLGRWYHPAKGIL